MKTLPCLLAFGLCGGICAPVGWAQNARPMEQDIRPGTVSGGRPIPVAAQFDPPAAPMHPIFATRPAEPEPPPPPNPAALLRDFTKAYQDAGAPRIAILYNQTFANKISSWSMDKNIGLSLPKSTADRAGFSTENLQWVFEEGFAKPFAAAGVRLVDAALIMQAADRRETWWWESRNVSDLNANVTALKQYTDWVVEVLMVPDSKMASGYLFRSTLKRLADGRIVASGLATLEEFRQTKEKLRVVYDDTGYRFVPDDSGRPTLDDYAQSAALKLLVDVTPRLAQLNAPSPRGAGGAGGAK